MNAGASACLQMENWRVRSDRGRIVGEDTEDNAVPNLRQEFLEVKIFDLDSSHCPVIKLATFFCLIRVDLVHGGMQFVLKPMCIEPVLGK